MEEGRRNLLKGFAGIAAAGRLFENLPQDLQASTAPAAGSSNKPTVKDRFWIWGHVAGSHNNQYGLTGSSRMSPAEGAFYLGVPNLIFVAYPDNKEPCHMLPDPASYDAYAMSFRPLKRIVWSIVGAGGIVNWQGVGAVRELARKFPNIVGAQMDDFFRGTLDGGRVGTLTPKELRYIRDQLSAKGPKLDLWVTLYRQDLNYDESEYLNEVNVVTYWTWEAKQLDTLQESFLQAEKAVPRTRKVLGCYMWDYGTGKPMPTNLMQKQCELGLKWLRKGRIEGMIFLASCICDLNLEAVEWTRNWIQEVGGETL